MRGGAEADVVQVLTLTVDVSFAGCGAREMVYCHRSSPAFTISLRFQIHFIVTVDMPHTLPHMHRFTLTRPLPARVQFVPDGNVERIIGASWQAYLAPSPWLSASLPSSPTRTQHA